MIRDLLKWVAPGVATLLAGTVAALAMTTPAMLADLAGQGVSSLSRAGLSWAQIAGEGRDLRLSGTVDDPERRDAALALLAAIPGIRQVTEEVLIAPLAAPYRLDVAVENGALSLSGHVPNAQARDWLAAQPGIAAADLSIRAGQPDEALWRAGVDFVLAQAGKLDSGRLALSGLTLSVDGRVNSAAALGAMQMALAARPAGLSLGPVALEPVRVAPYTWQAEFDGRRIAISGHVPEARMVERLRLADLSGLPVATGLALASGAPEGFADLARLLVEQLARLDHGSASIVDGVSRLSGAPPSLEVAQAVTEALSEAGSIVQLSPPRIGDYWVSVTRQPGGILVYDGYAPDQVTRDAFAENPAADIGFLKLGGGAPLAYHAGVDFGLKLLAHLSEGRFALNGNALSVSGLAETPASYRALRALLAGELPRNIALAADEIRPPRASRYHFALRRDAAGQVTLSGLLPSPEIERTLLAAAGPEALSELDYASGEPAGFLAAADQAIALLPWLGEGQVAFDGSGWIVSGAPASAIDRSALETEFAVRKLAQSGWELRLAGPEETPIPPEPEPAPPAAPEGQAEPEPATPAAPSPLALCRDRVAELSAHNAILFQSGNAIIADSAQAELGRFAEALALCPEARVHVEGHTDSDGDDQRNLALSVARAEAVVNALVERGVDSTRLYAIGYGESQPVADNATAEGKRQNRRIVVTVHAADE